MGVARAVVGNCLEPGGSLASKRLGHHLGGDESLLGQRQRDRGIHFV